MRSTTPKFTVAGVVVFKPQHKLAEYGYYEPVDLHPVLVYSETGSIEDNLFYKPLDTNTFVTTETADRTELGFLAEHLLQRKMSIEEAQSEYPEIFL